MEEKNNTMENKEDDRRGWPEEEEPIKNNPPTKGYSTYTNPASGSVATPKEEIFIDGDFNDSYEARVKRATGKNMIISKEHYTALHEALKELLTIVERKFNSISIDDAHSHREYIALKAIIERARKLLSK